MGPVKKDSQQRLSKLLQKQQAQTVHPKKTLPAEVMPKEGLDQRERFPWERADAIEATVVKGVVHFLNHTV